MNGERNLNILHVILAEREYPVFHVRALGTAAEVHYLEHLINGSTGVSNDLARSGYEAVSIKSTAVVKGDTAVFRHVDKGDRTRG